MTAAAACFFGIGFVLAFLSAVLYVGDLLAAGAGGSGWARHLARGAWVSQTLGLLARGLATGHAPFTSFFEALAFLSWSILFLFLLVDLRGPEASAPALGAAAMPLVFLTQFFAAVLPREREPAVFSQALKLHIAASLLGYGSFALAFCAALLYLIQERRLKRKQLRGRLHRWLPLDQADQLANRLVALGFALLSLGLVTGVYFATQDWHGRWWLDPKVLSSAGVWGVYAAYLCARGLGGWRGHRTMLLLVAGFVVVVIGFVGINLTGAGRHAYGF